MGLIGFIGELLVLGFCATAVVTNVLLIVNCEFLDLGGIQRTGSLGLFGIDPPDVDIPEDLQGECIEVGRDEYEALEGFGFNDAAWRTARVSACVAFGLGSVMFVFAFFQQCLIPLPCTQRILDLFGTATQVALALVYVIYQSEICSRYVCKTGDGAVLLWVTQGAWFFAAFFTRCMRPGRRERAKAAKKNPPPPKPEKKPVPPPPVVEEEIIEEEVVEEP